MFFLFVIERFSPGTIRKSSLVVFLKLGLEFKQDHSSNKVNSNFGARLQFAGQHVEVKTVNCKLGAN